MDENLSFHWILSECALPTLYQGALISAPLLISGTIIRLCVLLRVPNQFVEVVVALMGVYMLWFFYPSGILYFLALCGIVYATLLTVQRHKGLVVGGVSLSFLLICETYVATAAEWHQVRGSFLVMVMRMVSLGFDLEPRTAKNGEKKPPKVISLPTFMDEHKKFLDPSPINMSWISSLIKAWIGSMVCLAISSCIMPFLFNEPTWNKWLAAYTAAASFRYSHYFVSLLSQLGAISSGIGRTATNKWSEFHVVHPLAIELPRSLGVVVTNWNLPMHVFLKNYVYMPSRGYIGKFGAILATYLASALLHGLNFQLGAVLLSIGIYAYIENVLRYKLSVKLDACVLDRPCSDECGHKYRKTTFWVIILNAGFTFLAVYHLAYLGVMFGSQSPEERDMELQGFSMMHTLRKWSHLDFMSHWTALATYVLYLVL